MVNGMMAAIELMAYMLFTGLLAGGIISFFLFNKEAKVKILRILTKKNYGIVNLVSKGTVYSTIQNLSKSIFRYKDRVFYFTGDAVYVLKPQVVKGVNMEKLMKMKASEEDMKKYIIKKLTLDARHIKQAPIGIPIVYFNMDDIAPLNLDTGKPDEKFRDSRFVAINLDNEIEAERRKVLAGESKKKNIQSILTMALLGLLIIGMLVEYFQISTINKHLNMLHDELFPQEAVQQQGGQPQGQQGQQHYQSGGNVNGSLNINTNGNLPRR